MGGRFHFDFNATDRFARDASFARRSTIIVARARAGDLSARSSSSHAESS